MTTYKTVPSHLSSQKRSQNLAHTSISMMKKSWPTP